jgi:hypothetical protein
MAETPDSLAQQETIGHRWRFAVVLCASLMLAVAQPLLSGLFEEESSFDFFFSLLIIAVLLVVFEEKEYRRISVTTASLHWPRSDTATSHRRRRWLAPWLGSRPFRASSILRSSWPGSWDSK